jgi:hypothetical protein
MVVSVFVAGWVAFGCLSLEGLLLGLEGARVQPKNGEYSASDSKGIRSSQKDSKLPEANENFV